ncbi:hypothetical protein ACQP2P_16210 [Dactylosporangium sp. CA-139114]|uniref:hypothetical protein n=1 Tax=Dactylosporangium sp. CA-139114 TaxID=3239931 RepID=UPI003D98F6C3
MVEHVRADVDEALADQVAEAIRAVWPGWGRVAAPTRERLSVGLALHRHVSTWYRGLAPDAGLTEVTACAIKTGAELPAAQHRLIRLVL